MDALRKTLIGLLEKLREVVAPHLERRQPKPVKDLERWTNEGGH